MGKGGTSRRGGHRVGRGGRGGRGGGGGRRGGRDGGGGREDARGSGSCVAADGDIDREYQHAEAERGVSGTGRGRGRGGFREHAGRPSEHHRAAAAPGQTRLSFGGGVIRATLTAADAPSTPATAMAAATAAAVVSSADRPTRPASVSSPSAPSLSVSAPGNAARPPRDPLPDVLGKRGPRPSLNPPSSSGRAAIPPLGTVRSLPAPTGAPCSSTTTTPTPRSPVFAATSLPPTTASTAAWSGLPMQPESCIDSTQMASQSARSGQPCTPRTSSSSGRGGGSRASKRPRATSSTPGQHSGTATAGASTASVDGTGDVLQADGHEDLERNQEEEDIGVGTAGDIAAVWPRLKEVLGLPCDDDEDESLAGFDLEGMAGDDDEQDGEEDDGDEQDTGGGDGEDVLETANVDEAEDADSMPVSAPLPSGASSARAPRRSTRPAGATAAYLDKFRRKLSTSPSFVQNMRQNMFYPDNPMLMAGPDNPAASYLPRVLVFAPGSNPRNSYMKRCPSCGSSRVQGDGWTKFRRIIDLEDCFFALAQRYRCQNKHANNTFVAWDQRLLDAAPPHIRQLLPVILTRKLGISQVLFDLMRSMLDNGMGTGPFAAMIRENHTRTHHRRERAYLSRIAAAKPDEASGQQTLNSQRGGPPRFSLFATQDGYNGCYGSQRFFRTLYAKQMAKLEAVLKKHSATIPARLLSGDHFFKIIKCNFTFKGKRLFMAAYSLVNEHTEVIAAVLTLSKSLEELRFLLEGVQKRMVAMGLPAAQVEVFFTDNPTAEASFLEGVFPGLKKTSVPLYSLGGQSAADVLGEKEMLDFPNPHYFEYVVTRDAAALALDAFRRALLLDAQRRGVPPVIGLDAEWNISAGASRKLLVLQLSYSEQTLVLHLSRMGSIPHQLGALLRDAGIGKAGKMIAGDAGKLEREWGLPVRGWFELGMYAKKCNLIPNAGISLAGLVAVLLNKKLDKSDHLRLGDWSTALSVDAQRYAGLDSFASFSVYEAARTMPSATPGPGRTPIGMKVFLTDTTGMRRVARCTVMSSSVTTTDDAVEVELDEVYLPGYVVPKIGGQPCLSLCDVAAEGASKGVKPVFFVPRRHIRDARHPLEQRNTDDRRRRERVREALDQGDAEYDALPALTEEARPIIQSGVVEGTPAVRPTDGEDLVYPEGEAADDVDPAAEDFMDANLTKGLPKDFLPRGLLSGVRGDVMHGMDRLLRHLPKNHGALPVFSRIFSHAMMFYNKTDAEAAMRVASERFEGKSWAQVVYWHADWVNRRVRRFVPPPSVLAPRLQSVFSQFGSVIDASTKQPLFSAAARRAARQVIKLAADGWLSDPPGVGLYVLRRRDRDNLPLWLCCRGTNSNEGSVHQKLVKNFMSMKGASAELVHFAMVEWVHRHNLRAAHNNRPDFHSIGHSDVWILEDILQLQVEVYGERVSYLSYQAAGDLEVPDFHVGVLPISPDAIISYGLPQGEMLNTLQLVVDGLPEQKMWLAARMGVGVPVLPVHTLPEKLLYFKVQRVLRQKLGGPPTALQVCVEFNRLVGEMYLELVGKAEPVGRNKKLKTPQPDVYFKTPGHINAYQVLYDRSINAANTVKLFMPDEKQLTLAAKNARYANFGGDAALAPALRRPLPSHGAAAARQSASSAVVSTQPILSADGSAARRGAPADTPAPVAEETGPTSPRPASLLQTISSFGSGEARPVPSLLAPLHPRPVHEAVVRSTLAAAPLHMGGGARVGLAQGAHSVGAVVPGLQPAADGIPGAPPLSPYGLAAGGLVGGPSPAPFYGAHGQAVGMSGLEPGVPPPYFPGRGWAGAPLAGQQFGVAPRLAPAAFAPLEPTPPSGGAQAMRRTRHCSVCGTAPCPGTNNKKRCPSYVAPPAEE